jgi:hypothetical protein
MRVSLLSVPRNIDDCMRSYNSSTDITLGPLLYSFYHTFNMRNALLQRQNLTLKAIQVQQGRRRPKSVEIPFYPRGLYGVLSITHFLSSKINGYLYSQRLSPTLKKRCPYRRTAKTQYRKGIARGQSQFPHSCVCERFILVCLFCCRK